MELVLGVGVGLGRFQVHVAIGTKKRKKKEQKHLPIKKGSYSLFIQINATLLFSYGKY